MTDNPGTPETHDTPETPSTDAAPAEEPKATTKPEIEFDDFMKLDLRVATITQAEHHPNADRLLKLQLDLGALGPRQICAGIRGYEEPDNLVGKQIVVVANLKPRKIRGEVSNGMLMAASHLDADEKITDVVVLNPSRPVPAGAPVS